MSARNTLTHSNDVYIYRPEVKVLKRWLENDNNLQLTYIF